MEDATSFISAAFATFEDLSSRLILLPYNDDECTGAKVCSHDIIPSTEVSTDNSAEIVDDVDATTAEVTEKESEHADEAGNANDNVDDHDRANDGVESEDVDATIPTDAADAKHDSTECTEDNSKYASGELSECNHITKDTDPDPDSGNSEKESSPKDDENSEKSAVDKDATKSNESSESDGASEKGSVQKNTIQVPVGYVLVKVESIIDGDGDKTTAQDLETEEFASLLSLLREASYPLSLTFLPPISASPSSGKGTFFANGTINGEGNSGNHEQESENDPHHDVTSRTQSSSDNNSVQVEESESDSDETTDSEKQTKHSENSTYLSALASREDAAKAASQAATELRGRLSRWGLHAANRAAEAASAVKELKEERQRKIKDEEPKGDDPNTDKVSEKEEHGYEYQSTIDPSLLFLQTPSGFVEIPSMSSHKADIPTVTNTSVISVRLSKEKASQVVGKKKETSSYSFQWYRSKTNGISSSQCDIKVGGQSADEAFLTEWSVLSGACYAAYQPSISDVGRHLCCHIQYRDGDHVIPQTCILPSTVSVDKSLWDSALATLLDGRNSTTFCSLLGMGDAKGRMFRLKINVNKAECGNAIGSSDVYIDQMAGGSMEPLHDHSEPISFVEGTADPAKPRSFDLNFSKGLPPSASILAALSESSNGQLRLEAPNRAARESLLLAIGIANYRGNLSSLSSETIFFSEDELSKEIDQKEARSNACPISTPSIITIGDDMTTNKPNVVCKKIDNISRQCSINESKLEDQLSEMRRLLESKDNFISELQQKLIKSRSETSKVEKDLQSCKQIARESASELKKTQQALRKCESTIDEKNKTMGDSMQAQQLREIEQDKIVKALRNEKSVLSAIIEARDGKIGGLTGQVSSLEKKIISQSEHITKLEISKQHLIQTQTKCVTAEAMIAEMKKEVHEFQVELEKARNIIDDLNKKYEGAQMAASKACADAEKLQSDMRKLKMERNSMKHKADGLSKEISKIYKNRLNVEEAERMQHEIQQLRRTNIQLEDEVTDLRSQKRDALGELQATRIAHQQSVKYQLSVDENDGARAVEQRDELERLVSDLTEYLNAKEMQIETLKQINEALSKEINEANEKR